ncbi:unnamed protein product [Paramecium pentaurelia]|uniref:Uncharacterized protein n=1 Tax=Paramecium pentaurelia TaxID=43138 RepID=A0A8S1VHI4_9CILI|nr:unnamed protein product [Paramecium pentaurelia]
MTQNLKFFFADNSKSQDPHSSSFSIQKMQNSSQHGGNMGTQINNSENIVSAAIYLQQIDEKYSQMYMNKQIDKAKKDKSHNQKPSHNDHTQVYNNMDVTNKF